MGIVGDVVGGILGLGSDPEEQQEEALRQQSEMAKLAARLAQQFEGQARPIRELAFQQLQPMLQRGPQPAPDLSGLRNTANPFRSQFNVDLNTAPLSNEAGQGGGQGETDVPGVGGPEIDLERLRRHMNQGMLSRLRGVGVGIQQGEFGRDPRDLGRAARSVFGAGRQL